jgi:RNA polymerase sigma factor (sigma-70 family)
MKIDCHDLRRLFTVGACGNASDGQLLERFIAHRDEAAFEILVQRHGPMVWGVCMRVLLVHHDAEDAFQATFLVLARKAGTINRREGLASWLHSVAYQTARKARSMTAKRRVRETQVTDMPDPKPAGPDLWGDVLPVLDEEINRLADNHRAPIVLCDLEGKSRREAARQLGWPEGTVSSRLSRGRAILANRLARRGVVLSGGALAGLLAQNALAAGVPYSLLSITVKNVASIAAGETVAAGVISVKVASLSRGVLTAMLISKLKVVAVVALAVGLLGSGIGASGLAGPPGAQERTGREEQGSRSSLGRPSADRPATTEAGGGSNPLPRDLTYDQFVQSVLRERSFAGQPPTLEEFARRLYLDILGRTPTPGELQKIKEEESAHRAKLLRRLLDESVATGKAKDNSKALGPPAGQFKFPEWKRVLEGGEGQLTEQLLAQIHRPGGPTRDFWKRLGDCRSCHDLKGEGAAAEFDWWSEIERQKAAQRNSFRRTVSEIEALLKKLESDLPDRATGRDAAQDLENAVRALKERVNARTD